MVQLYLNNLYCFPINRQDSVNYMNINEKNIFLKKICCLIIFLLFLFQNVALPVKADDYPGVDKKFNQRRTANKLIENESANLDCHESGIASKFKALEDHIQRISSKTIEENRPVEYQCLGSGMDKGFYYREGDRFGWIDAKSEVIERELQAEEKLRNIAALRDMIPAINRNLPSPRKEQLKNGNCSRQIRGHGYWVERVAVLGATFKPKVMVFRGELLKNYKNLFKKLETTDGMPDAVKLKRTARAIVSLINELKPISETVSELTLALSDDGSLKMLDCAPNESGQTGGEELYDKGREGLVYSLEFINQMLPSSERIPIPVDREQR